jgi:multiphosphoryl transfer protein
VSTLTVVSPLSGWATRLQEMPDAAFAQGMVGDGVAVDPTSNELRAPCSGLIASVHPARHACTLRVANGAEILLHVGTNTVELNGEGFAVCVREGQPVRMGDPLIAFDMDLLARKAGSLLTAVVIVNGGYRITGRVHDRLVEAGEPLFAVTEGPTRIRAVDTSPEHAERLVRLLIPQGLHARPAAALARRARLQRGTVHIGIRDRSADGKSVASLMGLGTRHGDLLSITVTGEESEAVAADLAKLVAEGLGDPIIDTTAPGASRGPVTSAGSAERIALFPGGREVILTGSAAAPGVAVGHAMRVLDPPPEVPTPGASAAVEEQRLMAALAGARQQIRAIIETTKREDSQRAEIFGAHLGLLDDPELVAVARWEIANGRSAAWAWRTAMEAQIGLLRAAADPLVTERIGDLRDLERRVTALLTGTKASRIPANLPANAVLVAAELWPSEVAALPSDRVIALCTAHGGPTSHVAMLAAGMGIPAVVALGDAVFRIPEGASMSVDGDLGQVRVFPAAETRDAVAHAATARATRRRTHLARAHEECRTADGQRIEILANLRGRDEAAAAVRWGAEGCGLLRTEFVFIDRVSAPSEDEQLARYQEIADALEGRSMVVRTLDVGGDKPLAYLPTPDENNPALGLRGVRLALRHPELLRTQIRAILRVSPRGICRIMVPMVASPAELQAVRTIVEAERRALETAEPVRLGAMIEVPVAAVFADKLCALADFLSIGTNDLTQYGLAIDRGHPNLAEQLDGLHPGVLRLISQAVAGARTRGRPVAVCGAAAADPCAAALFIGLGVSALSVPPAAIPDVKAFIRTLAIPICSELARRALELDTGDAVRDLVANLQRVHSADGPQAIKRESQIW